RHLGTDAATITSQDLFNNKVAEGLGYAIGQGGNDLNTAAALLANVTATTTAQASSAAAAAPLTAAATTANANAAQMAPDAAATPMEQLRTQVAQLYVALLNRL